MCSPRLAAFLLLASVTFAGCSTRLHPPDLGAIYNRTAQAGGGERNPVIVIPGILGTRLRTDGGQVVWGAFGGGAADPETPAGARLIALPIDPDQPLRSLRDQVRPDGVLDRTRISLLGLPIELNAYVQILATLGAGGYRDELLGEAGAIDYGEGHYTCFQFDYDWRRDNVENAARLAEFIAEKKAYVRKRRVAESGRAADAEIRFDIVAHSMGGLLTRYFLRYGDADLPDDGLPELTWAGAADVERVVIVGTPNLGSARALLQLVEGAHFSSILPSYDAAILGTMPSIYQLLPRARHAALHGSDGPIDLLDSATWRRFGWGLASPRADLAALLPEVADEDARRRIAAAHLERCLDRARRFHAALDVPADPPAGVELHLFAGDSVATLATLAVDEDGRLTEADRGPGDGTVLRSSALADERVATDWQPRVRTPVGWHATHFLFNDHLGMTRDPGFSDNVLHLLLEAPRRKN